MYNLVIQVQTVSGGLLAIFLTINYLRSKVSKAILEIYNRIASDRLTVSKKNVFLKSKV